MRHLKVTDPDHTVILVQVENEIGMIPEARDHSPEAEKAFAAAVPATLMDYLAQHRGQLAPESLVGRVRVRKRIREGEVRVEVAREDSPAAA